MQPSAHHFDDSDLEKIREKYAPRPLSVLAEKPTGWWNCECGEFGNVPLSEECAVCHRVRPGYEKEPQAQEKQPAPKVQLPIAWKRIIKSVAGFCSIIVGALGLYAIFRPELKPLVTALKVILAAITGMTWGD